MLFKKIFDLHASFNHIVPSMFIVVKVKICPTVLILKTLSWDQRSILQ